MSEFEGQCSHKVRADDMAEKLPYKKLKLRLKEKPVTAFTNKDNGEAETQDNNDECKHTCPECFTSFHSVKSLHGHMRSHGDRKYRGMVPPEQKKSSHRIKTYSMDDQVVAGCSGSEGSSDLTRLWSREWPSEVRKPRTGCSGGTSAAASSCSVNGDNDKEEEELIMGAAYGILLLATGYDTYKTLPSSNKDGIRVSEPNNKKARSGDEKMEDGVKSVVVGKKRKREEEMRIMKSSYTCSICGKSFGSPRALRGHISGHASKKGCGGASLDPSHHGECVQEDVVAAASHVCKICDKEFLSGQALGGHMRFHNKLVVADVAIDVVEDQTPLADVAIVEADVAIVEDEAPIAEVVALKDEANNIRYCFDLNEIPADYC